MDAVSACRVIGGGDTLYRLDTPGNVFQLISDKNILWLEVEIELGLTGYELQGFVASKSHRYLICDNGEAKQPSARNMVQQVDQIQSRGSPP